MLRRNSTEPDPAGSPQRLAVSVVSSTSQGAREYQEDACGHWFDAAKQRVFAVVADGAGGHGGGAEAAQAAIASAVAAWTPGVAGKQAGEFLEIWMAAAHLAVNGAAAKVHRSARAVVVACFTDGVTAHWVHAGDSRLMRFHAGKLVERTRDDSVVQVLFERGEITEEEMGTHPDQSRLLQSLGGEEPPNPRAGSAEVEAGDVLILCSDGFWEHLRPAELEKLAATRPDRRQQALDQAVAEAVLRAGAKADNTTAVMIHCGMGGKPSRWSAVWGIFFFLLAAFAGIAAWWIGSHGDDRAADRTPAPPVQVHPSRTPSPSPEGTDQPLPSAPPLPESRKGERTDPLTQRPQPPGKSAPDPVQDPEVKPNAPLQQP